MKKDVKNIDMKTGVLLALLSSSGIAVAAEDSRVTGFERGQYRDGGRVYFNVATGERIVSLEELETQVGADGDESREIWGAGNVEGCPDVGSSSSLFFILDDYGIDDQITSPAMLDWADILKDTVVDCVMIHWLTNHQDEDLNSDGFADGVEGFGASWTFYDGMNGR